MLLITGYHGSGASNELQKELKSPSEQKSLLSFLQGQRPSSKREPSCIGVSPMAVGVREAGSIQALPFIPDLIIPILGSPRSLHPIFTNEETKLQKDTGMQGSEQEIQVAKKNMKKCA